MADREVDRWFAERELPAEPVLRRIREIILAADPRVIEYVKYGTVQFAFAGDMANFVQTKEKRVNLMFNRGARIRGDFPHLEGSGPSARFMRFADANEAEGRADELQRVVVAWCELMASGNREPAEPETRSRSDGVPPGYEGPD